ncbi:hypothetical protein HYPSUDRAFT_69092 [Hypholoma sublateritium FD-334 SS-4]|uniref:Uncharacterized protein n=1 Tax=Hypholoma sublateritium (strain FD-334 SS-4) TaxID=945553 RepID=A0A0D2NLE1_HYPSF|nr:hypothetical protein HYPSUDRAFT_69092 [Hypholoma sublateritium FD-334 SS-4]
MQFGTFRHGPGSDGDDTNAPGVGEGHKTTFHPLINGLPCDSEGQFLPENVPPPPPEAPMTGFFPFSDHSSFELANFLFHREQMSGGNINDLLQIWASSLPDDQDPPFTGKQDMYETVDQIKDSDIPWESFDVCFNGDIAEGDTTAWKHSKYELSNPYYAKEMDFAPKEVCNEKDSCCYQDFMSGNWAWRQVNHGSAFCPVILGSDKTTISVATGQIEYYPVYISNGLVYNCVHHVHHNALMLLGFLSIPKTESAHQNTNEFRKFQRSLFHGSLNQILQPLKQYMEAPEITIYGLGPYIADYPEQVLLACIVQGWCPRCDAHWDNLDNAQVGRCLHELTCALFAAVGKKALWDEYGIISDIMASDIHELLSPNLLHQIIKGMFKDHIVTWVTEYIQDEHPAAEVYLPAVVGHILLQMVHAISSFMEFCYLVQRSVLEDDDLVTIDAAVADFHVHCVQRVRPNASHKPCIKPLNDLGCFIKPENLLRVYTS